MKSVTESVLRDLASRIAGSLAPERILLFGSYAWGVPRVDSDVDLYVIVPDQPDPDYRLASVGYKALRGAGVPVDLVIRKRSVSDEQGRIASTLDHEVLAKGIPLYGRLTDLKMMRRDSHRSAPPFANREMRPSLRSRTPMLPWNPHGGFLSMSGNVLALAAIEARNASQPSEHVA